MIKKYFLAGLTTLLTTAAIGQSSDAKDASELQLNAITTAVPFLQITPDSRSGALGDIGTALSPSSNSFFWNTSMLAFSEEDSEISLSYSPWLQNIASDINLSHLAGFVRLNERNVIGGSLRYFTLGEIVFTDNNGVKTLQHNPSELELLGGYSFQLNEKFSLGLNGKFIYSDLTAGVNTEGGTSKPGIAGAADVSFSYFSDDVRYGSTPGSLAFGITLNNVGNKMTYSADDTDRDFLPTNLKLGTALTFELDSYNSLTWAADVSKLLVPTQPLRSSSSGDIISGYDPNVGVVAGMLQSFYDAPGIYVEDENGEPIQNADGTYQVEKGSRLKEELNEIMIGTGLEYWYNDLFAARAGYFYEHMTKGNRQHLTFGVGLKYNVFGIDFSYLTSLKTNNPLQNTIRFTLRLNLESNKGGSNGDIKPE
ncbi:type IX secretion system outer membrane channel protein PorV [Brumimicrobium aurantiacum]|uniref:Type IX secretion system protein PorV domain-containing protein n=1 Tax=Brumimicrobium aurantiacum TaxID=1737063 RepID=A0A3E1EWU0_9FLAO|nr:type IX secretion system outer membrane channel protein PorV [Brumimicrobium aurantiacum]RFC53992.1 hypothetical protein DXU93_10645 [Brumimicrobium aurantiacum]